MVEQFFRATKSLLHTRPIYRQWDATIQGHVFTSFLALVLVDEVKRRLRAKGWTLEWYDIKRDLMSLSQVEVRGRDQTYLLRMPWRQRFDICGYEHWRRRVDSNHCVEPCGLLRVPSGSLLPGWWSGQSLPHWPLPQPPVENVSTLTTWHARFTSESQGQVAWSQMEYTGAKPVTVWAGALSRVRKLGAEFYSASTKPSGPMSCQLAVLSWLSMPFQLPVSCRSVAYHPKVGYRASGSTPFFGRDSFLGRHSICRLAIHTPDSRWTCIS
jgi:hypothetical protein